LIWRFQTPAILLSEKHLTESSMSVSINPNKTKWAMPLENGKSEYYRRYKQTTNGISPLLFPPSKHLIKWNSYEHDEQGLTTEDGDLIAEMHDKRRTKLHSLIEYLKKMKTVNIYGDGKHVIFTFGSTTMSVLEALDYGNIDATVIQPIYLQPFPVWELNKHKYRESIVVEQNSTGQLEQLLKDKSDIKPVRSIRQYDGRPFDPQELAHKIKEVF
jgi:2-oxoglutarate ferredoxin oxidoreductase subunit alpha